ncbi:serine/threonine-protein kinase [Streptomyces sp. NPDC048442]|uniref:serine/threonine protein kinase n=1 Tax=Streptomyces sp. NPDC048442 TaxID=3154823 RepID=UPI00341A6703
MGWGAGGVDLPGRIGGYVVERELGSGGMGRVYLARSRGGRTVAVKVARAELADDPHFRARFRAEVEAARKVGGFHTAQVVDADPEAAAPWLATAYIPGPTLSDLLDERGPMAELQLRLLGAALAEALQAVHACGLVHRDLKPGNIIMAEDGPRVLDFGIARALESTRLTSTGAAFGTPGFLAPEQAQGLDVGSAADVFALGAVLVAAAGGSAFGAGTPMGLMYRSVHEEADLEAVPEGLRSVVAACLAKDPAQRPTPEVLLDALAPDVGVAGDYSPTRSAAAVAHVHEVPEERSGTDLTAGSDGPVLGGIASARTIDAVPRAEPPGQVASPRRARAGTVFAGVAGALLLVGIPVYAIYALKDPGGPFPAAKYELNPSSTLEGGAYELEGRLFAGNIVDTADRKDARDFIGTYTVTNAKAAESVAFKELYVTGMHGRLKNPKKHRDDGIKGRLGTDKANCITPPREIRVPGSNVVFSCATGTYGDGGDKTACAWADENTTGSVEFKPSGPLEQAAAETSRIHDELRKPIAP